MNGIGAADIRRNRSGRRRPRPAGGAGEGGMGYAEAGVLPGPPPDGAHDDGYAQHVRELSQRLVVLDNELNDLPVADMAVHAFAEVRRRLAAGDHARRRGRDIQAAAAELAEVAGWALFEAERPGEARRLNQEALRLAEASGDRAIGLLTLQNMGMQAGWLGAPREELAIARGVLERGRTSPRVEAIFRVREAKGLAGSGRVAEAERAFQRARSLLQESGRLSDPFWVWWVTADEVDGHHGFAHQESGDPAKAVPYLRRAMRQEAGAPVGYRNIYAARLLSCLLGLRAWRDAEELAEQVIPVADATPSRRTRTLLAGAARRGRSLRRAPGGLRDALHEICLMLEEGRSEL
ncbi:XRE family transcriptional regulator [Streptomyces sp. LX-29]|uniref:XRE family transcriptional regulator n=1 Tax=Streptomyces sp. LX-29 TaxID=2900152 RepID=UPI00240E2A11|nr:XRE family transcriptional regulator [Streptomyces sp. LX-29]WFB09474.1 XRE family transcriptional regulator [Streptomyces sp. LX-29]